MPELLGGAAASLQRERGLLYASALDAGCGTGLAGPYLRPLVSGPLIGVDLSPKMLERAARLRAGAGNPNPNPSPNPNSAGAVLAPT